MSLLNTLKQLLDKERIVADINTKETLLKMVQQYDKSIIFFALDHICKNDKTPRRQRQNLKAMVNKMLVLK